MATERRCVVCDRGFNARRKPHEVDQGEVAHKGCVRDAKRGKRWLKGLVAPDRLPVEREMGQGA